MNLMLNIKTDNPPRINIINDNILNCKHRTDKIQIIVHGCNSKGKMRSGVAKAIREEYPDTYNVYIDQYNKNGLKVGSVVWCYTYGVIIANAITQEFFGYDGKKYASYDAIDECFREINNTLMSIDHSQVSLNFPLIGCDLGGLEWSVVEQIILHAITVPVEMNLYILKRKG